MSLHPHILDVLPSVCSQVQHPEVLVVVELFPVGRGKLSPEHPELSPALGNDHRLRGETEGRRKGGEREGDEGGLVSLDLIGFLAAMMICL